MGVRFIISNFWRFWYDMDTQWSIGLLSTNPLSFPQLKNTSENECNFSAEERTRKNEHGFSFLEAVKVHITRISIFLQTKNAQTRTDSYCGKSNASKKRQCHFLQTQTMHNNFLNEFFPRKKIWQSFYIFPNSCRKCSLQIKDLHMQSRLSRYKLPARCYLEILAFLINT